MEKGFNENALSYMFALRLIPLFPFAVVNIAPGLLGESALAPLAVRRVMDGQLNGHRYAKAAIDIAVYDLLIGGTK